MTLTLIPVDTLSTMRGKKVNTADLFPGVTANSTVFISFY